MLAGFLHGELSSLQSFRYFSSDLPNIWSHQRHLYKVHPETELASRASSQRVLWAFRAWRESDPVTQAGWARLQETEESVYVLTLVFLARIFFFSFGLYCSDRNWISAAHQLLQFFFFQPWSSIKKCVFSWMPPLLLCWLPSHLFAISNHCGGSKGMGTVAFRNPQSPIIILHLVLAKELTWLCYRSLPRAKLFNIHGK